MQELMALDHIKPAVKDALRNRQARQQEQRRLQEGNTKAANDSNSQSSETDEYEQSAMKYENRSAPKQASSPLPSRQLSRVQQSAPLISRSVSGSVVDSASEAPKDIRSRDLSGAASAPVGPPTGTEISGVAAPGSPTTSGVSNGSGRTGPLAAGRQSMPDLSGSGGGTGGSGRGYDNQYESQYIGMLDRTQSSYEDFVTKNSTIDRYRVNILLA